MAVRDDASDVEGCSELESAVCHEFSQCVVSRAAGVVAGIKPGALFNFVPRMGCDGCAPSGRCRVVSEVITTYARELPRYGVELAVLHCGARKVALFAYRPELVEEIVARTDERAFLAQAGYDVSSAHAVVGCLRRRMHAYYVAAERGRVRPAYPHEVGLLLGYPLEDVRGFIRGDVETCRGPWKAYGDCRAAQARFGRLAMHESRCQALYQGGLSFGELFGSSIGA